VSPLNFEALRPTDNDGKSHLRKFMFDEVGDPDKRRQSGMDHIQHFGRVVTIASPKHSRLLALAK